MLGKTVTLEGLHQNGTCFPMELSLAAWETIEGRFITAVIRDISERKNAEASLRIAATAFESHEAMTITDANRVILKVNQAFTRITGYTEDEAVGQTPTLLKSGLQDRSFYQVMWASLERDCDTVARLGGDEFVVLLENLNQHLSRPRHRPAVWATRFCLRSTWSIRWPAMFITIRPASA